MERQEVFIDGKVYDLGLKGLDDAISVGESEGRTMELEVGPTVFQVGVLRQERAFALHWTGITNTRNVIWQRFVVLQTRWPFVKALSCFTNSEEDIYG